MNCLLDPRFLADKKVCHRLPLGFPELAVVVAKGAQEAVLSYNLRQHFLIIYVRLYFTPHGCQASASVDTA